VQFYDQSNNLLGTSATFGNQTSSWTLMTENELVPAGTDYIRMILMGTRNGLGADNDSYFDEMFVKLNLNYGGCAEYIPVSIDEHVYNHGVSVYPNPFSDEATIEILKPSRNATYQLEVFDRAGRMVYSTNSNSGKFTVSSSRLSSGFYLYRVTDGKWQSGGKLIVN
jgi:hypothetical protein